MTAHAPLLPALALALLCSCRRGAAESPAPEAAPDSAALVQRISSQSRLYTAEYRIHKIVTHDDLLRLRGSVLGHKYDTSLPLGDRKIAIPIDVTLKAYIDFSTFSARNVERSGDATRVTLPDPRVTVTASSVDYRGIREVTSLTRGAYSDREKSELTRQGVESVVRSASATGILESARESAARALIPLMAGLGYREDRVVVTFRPGLEREGLERLFDNEGSQARPR